MRRSLRAAVTFVRMGYNAFRMFLSRHKKEFRPLPVPRLRTSEDPPGLRERKIHEYVVWTFTSDRARTRGRHAKSWTVDDADVYSDDGISGAEFRKRPGFLRLMNGLSPTPAFHVLVSRRSCGSAGIDRDPVRPEADH